MLNIDTELDRQGVTSIIKTTATVTETVSTTPAPSTGRAFLAKPDAQWTWADLRDYVVSEIEKRFGAFARESKKEYGIFTRFSKHWGADAPRIARYAFEDCDGFWMGSPVTINRFTKGSDPYFAEVIANRFISR